MNQNISRNITQQSYQKVIGNLLKLAPNLEFLKNAPTIAEYLEPARNWHATVEYFPYREKLQARIVGEVSRLYGATISQEINAQLSQNFFIETGPHLALPRLRDRVDSGSTVLENFNTLAFQGALVMGALHQLVGSHIYLSVVTGRVPIINAISARYYQINSQTTHPLIANKYSGYPQIFIPALSEQRIKELENAVKKTSPLNETDKNRANSVIKAFREHPESLSDQVASANSRIFSAFLSNTGIKQITIEFEKIFGDYLIDLLSDTKSLFYAIFSNPVLRVKFITALSNIATGWKEGEQPFDTLEPHKESIKITQNYSGDLTPSALVDALKNRKILAKGALIYLALISEAGLLPLGGMYQTTYCTQLRDCFAQFLRAEMNECSRATALQAMPTYIATISPAWGLSKINQSQLTLASYQDVLDQKLTIDRNLLTKIAELSGESSLLLSSLALYNLLTNVDNRIGEKEISQLLVEILARNDIIFT